MENIFDVIKNLTSIKNKKDLNTNLYSPYIINRYLTMNNNYFIYGFILNRIAHIPKEYQELFLFYAIPKKYVFLKYIKDKKKKDLSIRIKEIQDELNCSINKALSIIEFENKLNDAENGF